MAIFVYLRFCLVETADRQDFEGDLRAMAELAEAQPGYLWSDMGASMVEPSVYIVVSEWYGIDHVVPGSTRRFMKRSSTSGRRTTSSPSFTAASHLGSDRRTRSGRGTPEGGEVLECVHAMVSLYGDDGTSPSKSPTIGSVSTRAPLPTGPAFGHKHDVCG